MALEWNELTNLTGGKEFVVTEVKFKSSEITIQGDFELPPLARLTYEDQVFVAMFIKVHGSIKEMEQTFGVSYPTIKSRLNKLSEQFGFVDVKPVTVTAEESVLDMLERGEITAQEAIKRIKS